MPLHQPAVPCPVPASRPILIDDPRQRPTRPRLLTPLAAAAIAVAAAATPAGANDQRWGPYLEPDQSFHGMVLDARGLGDGLSADNNLTPRGLLLPLDHDLWVCFDTDLLRVSLVWQGAGDGFTRVSMSAGSYHDETAKADPGQATLPQPVGALRLATDIHPGAAAGGHVDAVLDDPRPPTPVETEVGRGGLPWDRGRWRGIDLADGTPVLVYDLGGVRIRERMHAVAGDGVSGLRRHWRIDAHEEPLVLVLSNGRGDWRAALTGDPDGARIEGGGDQPLKLHLEPSAGSREISVVLAGEGALEPLLAAAAGTPVRPDQTDPGERRWPQVVEVAPAPGDEDAPLVMDTLHAPMDNPWRRNLRIAAIDFFSDGRAAAVTYDGDLWLVDGWDGREPGQPARWQRFGAGLHEPLSMAIRDDQIFVADRNGIQRLSDTTGNGEADWYECYTNLHGQTAETREFATGLEIAPDGAFILSKGGQSRPSLGHHNGSVLRISPEGDTIEVLGWGLRMPFIGVHPETGWVTASDQQGQWVPATPLHYIHSGRYYGFVHEYHGRNQYPDPIEPPAAWLPHPFNKSGVSQVWAPRGTMGVLSGRMIHLGYERSAVYVAALEPMGERMQAAVSELPVQPTAALLNGAAAPHDGHVYVTGFRIWDSFGAPDLTNVFRLRPGAATLPVAVGGAADRHGIRLDFAAPVDPDSATEIANYSVERWNYQRSERYGSGHYRLDGEPGSEPVAVQGVALSGDRTSLYLALGDMRPANQLGVRYTLRAANGDRLSGSTYLTGHDPLPEQEPGLAERGFDAGELEPLIAKAGAAGPLQAMAADQPAGEVSVELGAQLSEMLGCIACHSIDGTTEGRSGPSWLGIYDSKRPLVDGTEVLADKDYLWESIVDPEALIVAGYDDGEVGMPAYRGILQDYQIESIIEYIKTLE